MRGNRSNAKYHYGFMKGKKRITIYNLDKYCRDNKLSKTRMRALKKGEIDYYAGYTYCKDMEQESQEEYLTDDPKVFYQQWKRKTYAVGFRRGDVKKLFTVVQTKEDAVRLVQQIADIMLVEYYEHKVRVRNKITTIENGNVQSSRMIV